jgi:hypothetical protein
MDKVEKLLKEIETVNERYIEDLNHYTNEVERWLPSVSSTIISSAQKVVKIFSFLPLWLSPPYDNIIRLEYFNEGKYIMVRVDDEGIMIPNESPEYVPPINPRSLISSIIPTTSS